jgi:hypothetical protein
MGMVVRSQSHRNVYWIIAMGHDWDPDAHGSRNGMRLGDHRGRVC